MNGSHIRRLSIVMRSLEDAVAEIEDALEPAAAAAKPMMTVFEDDIPLSARGTIRKKLEEIRNEIRAAKDYYDLYAEVILNRRRLSTRLSVLAIDLTECRPEYLRGYGEVPDAERIPLGERMSRLEAAVGELNRLLTLRE